MKFPSLETHSKTISRQTQTSPDKGSHRNSEELSSVAIFSGGWVSPYRPCRRQEEKRHDDVEEKEEALGVPGG